MTVEPTPTSRITPGPPMEQVAVTSSSLRVTHVLNTRRTHCRANVSDVKCSRTTASCSLQQRTSCFTRLTFLCGTSLPDQLTSVCATAPFEQCHSGVRDCFIACAVGLVQQQHATHSSRSTRESAQNENESRQLVRIIQNRLTVTRVHNRGMPAKKCTVHAPCLEQRGRPVAPPPARPPCSG
jgi:hypothetical protein